MARPGRLSLDDMKFIRENAAKFNDAEIAKIIDKSEESVKNYRRTKIGIGKDLPADAATDVDIRNTLYAREDWMMIKQQLSDEHEIRLFEEKWIGYFKQFRGDVWATEESAIGQMIFFEIDMMRLRRRAARLELQLAAIDAYMKEELSKGDDKDETKINTILTDKIATMQMGENISKDLAAIQLRIDCLMKILKGTREQRIKNLEDANKGVMGLLQKLIDPVFRNEVGTEMALVAEAVRKEKLRLSEYYTYSDGEICQPLISAETIKDDNV